MLQSTDEFIIKHSGMLHLELIFSLPINMNRAKLLWTSLIWRLDAQMHDTNDYLSQQVGSWSWAVPHPHREYASHIRSEKWIFQHQKYVWHEKISPITILSIHYDFRCSRRALQVQALDPWGCWHQVPLFEGAILWRPHCKNTHQHPALSMI